MKRRSSKIWRHFWKLSTFFFKTTISKYFTKEKIIEKSTKRNTIKFWNSIPKQLSRRKILKNLLLKCSTLVRGSKRTNWLKMNIYRNKCQNQICINSANSPCLNTTNPSSKLNKIQNQKITKSRLNSKLWNLVKTKKDSLQKTKYQNSSWSH